MGSDTSKLRHSASAHDGLPSIKLPVAASYYDGIYPNCDEKIEVNRSRAGSASSKNGSPRHPLTVKARRLIQSCFSNPHELVGRRIMKRASDSKPEFAAFYTLLDAELRDELEESVKMLLKKVVTNLDFVDEVQRLSEEFGQRFVELRPMGFRPDLFATLADSTIKECTHLDSAVHKAHTTTHAFSQFGAMVFSAVRDGYYHEVRRVRRASNSFSTGSNGSGRRKKSSIESNEGSRGGSPRTSFSRGGSPRSVSPESQMDDNMATPESVHGEFLKPPNGNMMSMRSY